MSLTPTPLVATFSYNAIGNLTYKSDVGAYNYPAPGQPRPHGVTSVTGGSINATFTYDAKGNLVAGNGLTVTYTASNKAKTIARGTTTVAFDHDPEHQRFAQTGPNGVTLYLSGMGVLAERFGQLGGPQRWTNYLIVGGRLVGIQVENADETTLTRWFHPDHLGSIAVITDEVGVVTQRLSYDAWGLRRHPDGTPDPAGAIQSESTRGFTGHEHLAEVGLIHMNGRVYDPLLARFGTPDPMTEDPYSTQGWNRYSYVGNSPVNFTDPSGYCFMGCFWKPMFAAIGRFFQRHWGTILQIAATTLCSMNPVCAPFLPLVAGAVSGFVAGVTSGDLGVALRAAAISAATTYVAQYVGEVMSAGGVASAGTGTSDGMMRLGAAGSGTAGTPGPGMPQNLVSGANPGAPLVGANAGPATSYINAAKSGLSAVVPGYEAAALATQSFNAGNYGTAAAALGIAAADIATGGIASRASRALRLGADYARRGLSHLGGIFSSQRNAAGGKVWTSVGEISQRDIAPLVNGGMYTGEVHILSGVHGTPAGKRIPDRSLYEADVRRFGDLPDVHVYNLDDMADDQIRSILNRPGTIIGGFCDSAACLAPLR